MKQHCRRQDVSVGIMDEIGIGLLSPKHENAAFDCGNVALNTFLHKHATFNIEHGISRVYVATRVDDSHVLGYYATSAGTFRREHLPPDDRTGLPGYPLPTVHSDELLLISPIAANDLVNRSCSTSLLWHATSQDGSECSAWICSPRMTTRSGFI